MTSKFWFRTLLNSPLVSTQGGAGCKRILTFFHRLKRYEALKSRSALGILNSTNKHQILNSSFRNHEYLNSKLNIRFKIQPSQSWKIMPHIFWYQLLTMISNNIDYIMTYQYKKKTQNLWRKIQISYFETVNQAFYVFCGRIRWEWW